MIRFKSSQDKALQVGIGPALLPQQHQEEEQIPDEEQEEEQEQDALGSNYFSLNLFRAEWKRVIGSAVQTTYKRPSIYTNAHTRNSVTC